MRVLHSIASEFIILSSNSEHLLSRACCYKRPIHTIIIINKCNIQLIRNQHAHIYQNRHRIYVWYFTQLSRKWQIIYYIYISAHTQYACTGSILLYYLKDIIVFDHSASLSRGGCRVISHNIIKSVFIYYYILFYKNKKFNIILYGGGDGAAIRYNILCGISFLFLSRAW